MTMEGSTPKSRRCMVPLILKLCPRRVGRATQAHNLLHLSMNQRCSIGSKQLVDISKPKICMDGGHWDFNCQWFWKAHSALHEQPESIHKISSPWQFILIEEAQKELKVINEAVLPAF